MSTTMGRLSPTPSSSSEGSTTRDPAAATTNASTAPNGNGSGIIGSNTSTSGSGPQPSTRNFKASQAASIAAVVESTSANRNVIPGLAELMGGSTVVGMMSSIPYFKGTGGSGGGSGGGSSASEVLHTRIMNANTSNSSGGGGGDGDNAGNAMDMETATAGHPSLPSMEAVSTAASRLINECPPFMTMSARDSAPQLRLEDPPPVAVVDDDNESSGANNNKNTSSDEESDKDEKPITNNANFQRPLVVKGGMKGYRMSRATHGATSGCYYYEAVILGSSDKGEDGSGASSSRDAASERGVKRPLQEMEETAQEKKEKKTESSSFDTNERPKMQTKQKTNNGSRNGHIRIGWSTRNADLQAPVGYNEHSYGIRDIAGSRIHKSRREDEWGGVGFGPGDVLGLTICLVETKTTPPNATTTSTSLGNASVGMENNAENMKEVSQDGANTTSSEVKCSTPSSTLTNHIRFFKNGQPMGNGIAFDNITPGTYHPSVSCYMTGAAQLNFGPHFIYPPQNLPAEINLHPISDLCSVPPLPEEAMEKVISGGRSSGKEGKKMFFSKRTNDSIVSAFKELVKTEATVRHEAYLKHLELHRREIMALRKERGLSTTLDLLDGIM